MRTAGRYIAAMADQTAVTQFPPHGIADARQRVADFPWAEVPEPAAGSGAMTHEDGRIMTEAEVDEWFSDRLRARSHA